MSSVPKPRRRDRVGTLPSGSPQPPLGAPAQIDTPGIPARIGPARRGRHRAGHALLTTIADRPAAHQPSVARGEQFTPGGVETWIGANSIEHAADGLTGRRGVAEQAAERAGFQVEELLQLLDRRRVRCPRPSWEPAIRDDLRDHTRVSAVCLFAQVPLPRNDLAEYFSVLGRLIVNPSARRSLPSWIIERLAALREP